MLFGIEVSMTDLLIAALVAAALLLPWWAPRWRRWLDGRGARARALRAAQRRATFHRVRFPDEEGRP